MLLTLIKIAVVMGVVQLAVAYVVLLERRVLARMQSRSGPNRVGFGILATLPVIGGLFAFTRGRAAYGLGQPLADGVKLFLKEDLEPAGSDRWAFRLAPVMTILTVFLGYAVIPLGPDIEIFGLPIKMQVSEMPVALVYLLAVGSLGSYGVILAGWASNSKYSLMGSLRAAAQLVSYELPLGLALLSVVLLSGSLSLREIVGAQQGSAWFIFLQPVSFVIAVICLVAEANRPPFDLAEAESELVGGFHTEYSGMKFALFFLAEYSHMFLSGTILACVFLGGWTIPYVSQLPWVVAMFVFTVKIYAFMLFCIWLRGSFPRFRYDQLMAFSWKVLTPMAAVNLIATAILGKIL